MSSMFSPVEDAAIILRRKGGVYIQAPAYAYNGNVFARVGSGFIAILKYNNGTSNINYSWEELSLPFELEWNEKGRLVFPTPKP
jgi:hypothetical protein